MQKQSTQVVIIGAGPSGATAAALLKAQNIDVIVLEKAQFPSIHNMRMSGTG
ncbi:NAD(P)-binding protein [Vibrio tarriae]|uniref:NAD(P)-binding protein n=1 Tax=Vibrio tarriae TaxID=2014742 RepID=UPI00358F3E45